MRWLMLLAALAVTTPALAQQTRDPEVLVLLNTDQGDDPAQAHRIWGFLNGILKAHGVKAFPVGRPHNKPLIAYTQGLKSGSGAAHFWNWNRERDFDGLIIVNWDWPFRVPATNGGFADTALDSLSRVGKYPTIPTLLVHGRSGFVASSSVCSLGVTGFSISKDTNVMRQPDGASFMTGSAGTNASLVTNYADGSITRLLTGVTGSSANTVDTAYVWHRAAGAGITVMGSQSSSGNENTILGAVPANVAVTRWLQDFPDSLRPHPTFPFAVHIDDGFKRNAEVNTQHLATISACMDSLSRRSVKYTVGVECTRDTLDLIDDNGVSVFQNDFETFYRGGVSKFTPHTHAGNSSSDQNMNASAAALKFFDIFGADRQRDCDPESASDSSSYALMNGALRYLELRFGRENVDYCTMPATDDWVPPNVYASPFSCSFENYYAATRRAGFTHIREAWANMDYSRSEPFGIGGLGWGPRTVKTDYGNLIVTGRAWNGYYPDSGEDTKQAATTTGVYLSRILGSMWLGSSGYNSFASTPGQAPTNMIAQHVRNYTDSAPGLDVITTIDNYFTVLNSIWGYRAYKWVWSDELPAPGTQGSVGASQ